MEHRETDKTKHVPRGTNTNNKKKEGQIAFLFLFLVEHLFLLLLCPSVFKGNRAIEHNVLRGGIPVNTEVANALKLEFITSLCLAKRTLAICLRNN